jgi:ATP-dependent DNA helicase RecG
LPIQACPDVANAFFRAGMIEAWGRGIERILQACRAAGTPAPVFRSEQSGLWAEFAFNQAATGQTPVETRVETRVETPGKTPELILEILGVTPRMSLPEVAARIGRSSSAVERAVAKLRRDGRLTRVGPDKGGHWEIVK